MAPRSGDAPLKPDTSPPLSFAFTHDSAKNLNLQLPTRGSDVPDLRKLYQAVPGGAEGAKIPHGWNAAQGITVTPNQSFGWNHFTTHLTIELWDTKDQVKRIKKFHLSFKKWKGKSMSGPGLRQPGCSWEWNSASSTFQFKGWVRGSIALPEKRRGSDYCRQDE